MFWEWSGAGLYCAMCPEPGNLISRFIVICRKVQPPLSRTDSSAIARCRTEPWRHVVFIVWRHVTSRSFHCVTSRVYTTGIYTPYMPCHVTVYTADLLSDFCVAHNPQMIWIAIMKSSIKSFNWQTIIFVIALLFDQLNWRDQSQVITR